MTCDRATEPHMQPIANRELVAIFANVIPTAPSRLLHLRNHFSPGIQASRCARCTTTTRRSVKLTNTTLASALISSIRSNNARTPAASECAVSKQERGICRVAASKQRATVQSAAAGCQAHSLREMRWHRRQRLPTPNASTLRRKTQHANGGCVRTRCLLQALYRGESTAAPRATQVAAPTTPSLGKASNAQLNIGSAAIYSAVTVLCIAAISASTTTRVD